MVQTDRQAGRQTDERTDGRTERRKRFSKGMHVITKINQTTLKIHELSKY